MQVNKGYDFDDLLLVPSPSHVNSREDVDLSVNIKGLHLDIPIIASPMKGIISPELMIELSNLGGIGILHRFFDNDLYENFLNIARIIAIVKDKCKNWGVSVGLNDKNAIKLLGLNPSILCLDVANGNLDSVRRNINILREAIDYFEYQTLLMAGNVADIDSANLLSESGADLIRVGIGNGALCTTRNVTGVGVPQLTAIDECSKSGAYIICDGGIRNSGDAVKALAMGADLIMMGTPFAITHESAHNGIIYGMASRKLQEEYYHSVKSIEGLEKEVEKKVNLKDFISEFTWGMKSAFTYLNARNIKELQSNASWIETGTGSIKKL